MFGRSHIQQTSVALRKSFDERTQAVALSMLTSSQHFNGRSSQLKVQKWKRNPMVGSMFVYGWRKLLANPPFTCENMTRNRDPTSVQTANR